MNNILNKIAQMERNAAEIAEVQLNSHKVELSLLDEVLDLNREAGSLLSLPVMKIAEQLSKSIELNRKGLSQAEKGLKAAQDLGVQDGIDIFKRWVKSCTDDIKRAEKGQKILADLSQI